jgi:pimeloyl-ACP methyl ester carboxylesterase
MIRHCRLTLELIMRLKLLLLLSALLIGAAITVAQESFTWLDALGGYPCDYSEFTCVTLAMPLDHFDPDSEETIDVTFAVLPASGERKGMFVTVVGGPGGSGLAVADSYTAAFDPAITESFDIVFFDQRGVGASGGLDCPDAILAYYSADARTDTPEQEAAVIETARTFAEDCVAEMDADAWLPYLGTAQAIEDLELFRQQVGDEQFWLYGESYGTQFSQTYAATYPEHVAGLILDGVVDLTLEGIEYYAEWTKAFDYALQVTLDACNADPVCVADMGGNASEAYDNLVTTLQATPVTIQFPLPSGTMEERLFTESDLLTVAGTEVYENTGRMMFLRALAAATNGDFIPLARMAYVDYEIDPQTLVPSYDPSFSSGMYYGTECNDYSFFDGTPQERAQAYIDAGDAVDAAYPRMSSLFYSDLPCAFWPVEGLAERPEPFTGEGIPTFVLNATTDPATPISNGYDVYSRLDEGYMITLLGGPHVIFGRGSTCPDVTITAFLVDNILPVEREFVCNGDPIPPYVPLASTDDLADPADALQAIDDAIYYLPEYYSWDLFTPTLVGCPYGGVMSFSPTADGDQMVMAACELIDGAALTGTGYSVYGESFSLYLNVSGAVEGDVIYTRDDTAGMFSVSGVWNGEDIALRPD